ncbi:hypothetical protein Sbal625DRAFT_4399 [Shewanella baltica OS625]|nr:hypothetical protein [Shewanella baltica]EHC03922.1 hypothetical protein Sbal625DRAFT_4399 [Shewanella baltica OS625]
MMISEVRCFSSSKESAFLEGGFDLPQEGAIPRTYQGFLLKF